MSLTITQARDDMLSMVKAAIDASSYASMKIIWDDVEPDEATSADEVYMKVDINHLFGGQTSLGRPRARFTRRGVIRCCIYALRGSGMSTSDEIAQIVLDAFEGQSSPGGVWFRNASPQERQQDGKRSRLDVVIEFTYDEQK